MGDNYPMSPPEARFITPIYHPNINRHGRICHSILDRNWTLDTSTKDLIDTIYSLLLVPEFSDPINTVVTLNYHWDEVQFKEEAQRHIEKHASKSRESWRNEIVGQAE
jgi:ubiquitin-protein ligase